MMNNENNPSSNFYFTNDCTTDDIFLCGKCQCQFKDIKLFMDHKSTFCVSNYNNIKQNAANHIKLPILASENHNFSQNTSFYTDNVNQEYIGGYEASTAISYLYNDGNTPKNNINGSYVSFVDNNKYQPMEFAGELNEDCFNTKNSYFNIYPVTNHIFNVDNDEFSNVDFGYLTHNGNYIENIDNIDSAINNQCLYNYDSNKILINSTKNDIEIVNIENNAFVNNFNNNNNVEDNRTQTVFTVPSFKEELLGESVNMINNKGESINIINNTTNIEHSMTNGEIFKGKDYNTTNKDCPENSHETVIIEQRANTNKVMKKYECEYCLKVFFRYSNLEQHLRLHTGEKPFQCPICGRKFSQKSNAKKHIKSHKVWINGDDSSLPKFHTIGVQLKDKRHLIVRPSKSLSTIINRKQFHLLTNLKNKSMFGASNDDNNPVILVNNSFECSFCKQKFQSYQKLRTHIIIHKDLQVYLCVFADCKLTFEDLNQFLQHLEAHKKEENIQFNCQFCCTQFTTLYELMCHYKEHNDNGNISSKCQKCYKQIQENRCGEYKKKFADKDNEYLCYHCNKTFKSRKIFKTHIDNVELRQHFTCPICSKGFSSEIYLNRHVRILHKSSLLLFKCKQCDKVFRTMSSLKYHRSAQHKILPHPDCKVDHYDHKKHCTSSNSCQCLSSTKRRKGIINSVSKVVTLESQTDTQLKQNLDEDGMVCFYCGKLYRRRLPFESHVLMCKQKEIEKERRESYRNQRSAESKLDDITVKSNVAVVVEEDKSTRRAKFKKTWTVKSTKRKSCLKNNPLENHTFTAEIKQTLPSISILNKSYDLPIESSLNPYDSETFSFLKSLEFNN